MNPKSWTKFLRCFMKYSYEQKLSAVLAIIEQHEPVLSVARFLGISQTPLRRWLASYNEFGAEGLRMKPDRYSGEFKSSVISYMNDNHLSLTQTATKFSLPCVSTVSRWESIYRTKGVAGLYLENRGKMKKTVKKATKKLQPEDLISEVERLRAENAYLKKVQTLVEKRIAYEKQSKSKPSKN